jgi:signal peptidase II
MKAAMDKVDPRIKAVGVAALIFALDRFSKWLVETHVSVLDVHNVIPGFFDIVHSNNRGVAFSLFHNSTSPWRTTLLILAAVVALVVVGYMILRSTGADWMTLYGLALIFGGATGNLFDRVVRGAVTDFLDFYVGEAHWPAFNVADSAVVIGSALLIFDLLKPKREPART